jgi:hypothetical protein
VEEEEEEEKKKLNVSDFLGRFTRKDRLQIGIFLTVQI